MWEQRVKRNMEMWRRERAEHMIWHFASLNVAKLIECLKGCKIASEGSGGTKRKQDKHGEYSTKDKSDRQYALATMWEIGQQQENTHSQKVRHYKDWEFTSYVGEETNIYWTTNGEIWHRTKGMEPEGFQDVIQHIFAPTQKKWTAKMASKSIMVTFSANQNNAIHFSSVILPLCPQGL